MWPNLLVAPPPAAIWVTPLSSPGVGGDGAVVGGTVDVVPGAARGAAVVVVLGTVLGGDVGTRGYGSGRKHAVAANAKESAAPRSTSPDRRDRRTLPAVSSWLPVSAAVRNHLSGASLSTMVILMVGPFP